MLASSYYLRLSVTDACNLSCRYCRPRPGLVPPPASRLGDEETLTLLEQLGREVPLRKIRLTGGEPLLRQDLPGLVRAIAKRFPGVQLCLTTNGVRLASLAGPLHAAGITSINVSLDTLDPGRFVLATGGGRLADVLEGIAAARRYGRTRVKLNAVLQRTINGDHLVELVRFAAASRCELRFIELMPMGNNMSLFGREHLSTTEALAILGRELSLVRVLEQSGTARRYLFRDDDRETVVGMISPVSRPFCASCDRLRLDAYGRLYSCMRLGEGVELAPVLRGGDHVALRARIGATIAGKQPVTSSWPDRAMLSLGG